ncbi:50S ribosomal protein L4 [Dyadobacter subterraneus]|uniref:Large ribosomal subunit protein uL4 n=2 Tax=Dyadobacter TaxID=120831 RepID=A0A1H7ABL5_9BACT|nr:MULTISPECIES: 50S ribosomal protein L4 [Dyadobacter]MBE9465363.1 50S ribosomal protein L4 [Dyadobacter subterraneus]MCF0057545.1 50S ribosomal protein L4 [Dyadobacter sp. CY356]MCF2445543.1 50S ribosomal protein L4 [Dyadobacter sp. CY345]SEJ62981.1 LSU ribosomal protein L4P [Dyadobacter koreensis]
MELSVLNIKGEDTGKKVSVSEEIFGIEPNEHAIYLDVKLYLANQRQGTHKSKERAEINHSTRKIKKQKGTGGARAGSIKSPVFVGGGRIFGPRPRNYTFKINRKVKTLARISALSAKAKIDAISVLESFTFDAPKTKSYLTVLNSLSLVNTKTLLILPEVDSNVYLSSRNIPKAKVTTVDLVNTYDLMNADRLLISESALSNLETLLNK